MMHLRSALAASLVALAAAATFAVVTPASSQNDGPGPGCYISHYVPDLYANTQQPVYVCPHGRPAGPPVMQGTFYAAIAKSASGWNYGSATHAPNLRAAESKAIADCNSKGVRDCKVAVSGGNNCMSLALSKSDGAWSAQVSNLDRASAISIATADCRKRGGRSCVVAVTPCGRSAEGAPQCNRQYKVDISKGEAWQHMTPQEKAMWGRQGNGNCTPE